MANTTLIRQVVQRIQKIVDSLLESNTMVRGSFSTVHRKCGKSNCWCATSEKGHATTRITWTEDGISRTKVISDEEDRKEIQKATENYRRFRLNRRQLRAEEKLLEKLLDSIEEENQYPANDQ